MRVAINGFGRIGRAILRAGWSDPSLSIVHINDLTSPDVLAHLLKYDSVHGIWDVPVVAEAGGLRVGDRHITVTAERDPALLPWRATGVEVVLECTGAFNSRSGASKHLEAGAQRVILSAPGKDVDATFVYGVNHHDYDAAVHRVISNASCTTNCLAPVVKVLHDTVGIEHGLMTTVHSYTMDQNLLDAPHRKGDLRRARAAGVNMVPTSTGAAKAIGLVLPELAGRLEGMAIRVPTPNGSLVDLTVRTQTATSAETLHTAFESAAAGALRGVLTITHEPLVLSDIVGNPASAIVDAESTDVIDGRMVKVLAWYDNEWGFSNRMLDLTRYIGAHA